VYAREVLEPEHE